jgi:spore coat polysaccharide biosynthesis protein SpsF
LKTGIIIQARLGSNRLPKKVLLDFDKGKSILQIIVENLISKTVLPIVIATTNNTIDDEIIDFCKNFKINYYRGDENDVLKRFIQAATQYNFTHIIRVCADNPFLHPESLMSLYNSLLQASDADYISFKVSQKPSILTHFGFWAELVSLNALQYANNEKDHVYHEHVTNYIYQNPAKFKIFWLNVSNKINKNSDIRLTVDNHADFLNAQKIFKQLTTDFEPELIIDKVLNDSVMISSMKEQIHKYEK